MLRAMQDKLYYFMTDEEKVMTKKKQPKISIAAIVMKFRLARQKAQDYHLFPKSFFFGVCTKPLSSLKRTTVSDLLVNIPSEGNYILVRTLELPVQRKQPPIYDPSVLVPVEDHLGDASICCLYGHVLFDTGTPLDDVLPVSTVFALKEPCLKYCSTGNFAVVVGSPSDVIIIDRSHALAKDVENLGWRSKITVEGISETVSNLVLEWKSKGNDHFAKGKFERAKEDYLFALGFAKKSGIEHVLHLNLSAVYLNQGFYESAAKHAQKVLEMDPKNEKALFRAGRAYYELGQYANAKTHFETLLLEHPSNTKAMIELDRSIARIEEGSGKIDMLKLFRLNRVNPAIPVDCGNYMGPIKLPYNTGHIRRVFATEDIKPGTLILAEKSVDITYIYAPYQDQGTLKHLQNAISAVFRNPETFGRQILSLCDDKPENMFCDEENCLEPIVDVRSLIKIVYERAFLTDKKTDYRFPTISQTFPIASKINHSCMSNSTLLVYNDLILVRACSFIRKGEEVTMSYWPNELPFFNKKLYMKMFRRNCKCLLCEADAKESEDIHNRRDALRNEMNKLVNGNCKFSVGAILKIVKQMEETYKNRESLRIQLSSVYLPVARSFMDQAAQGWEALFMASFEKGLQAVGLSVELLLRAATNEDLYLPKNALFWDDLFDYAALMVEKEFFCRRGEEVSRWVKVLMFLERVFRGGNFEMLRDRFRDQESLVRILSDITEFE